MCIATTFSRHPLDLLRPQPEHIEIEDIAHGLANTCRFSGQSQVFYSVADHSWRVACYMMRRYHNVDLALAGLMHDAAEAYLPDIHSGLKKYMAGFQQIEERMLQVIFKKYNLTWPLPAAYKEADAILLATEGRDLMGWDLSEDCHRHLLKPLDSRIDPLTIEESKLVFLDTFQELARMKRFNTTNLILKNSYV